MVFTIAAPTRGKMVTCSEVGILISRKFKRRRKPGSSPKKRRQRITRASAKAKGRRLQQWTCQQISDLLGIPWGKDELIASREASQSGTDIRLIGEAQTRFPFSVECKSQETWSLPAWIRQAQSNQKEGTDWLLVIKRSYQPAVVVMDAERFFSLLSKIEQGEGPE